MARSLPTQLTGPDITYSTVTIYPPFIYIKKRLKILEIIATKNFTSTSKSTNNLKSLIHFLANSKSLPKTFKTTDTSSLRLLTHVLSGHSHLNSFKAKLNRQISPLCHLCCTENETSFHYLCRCPYYSELRLRTFGKLYTDMLDLYKASVHKLISYIKNSGRFSEYI